MSTILETETLTKNYGKGVNASTALRDVTLPVAKDEIVAILGKSGSGKSTLMHLMALLDKPSSGTVRVNGQDASKLSGRALICCGTKPSAIVQPVVVPQP